MKTSIHSKPHRTLILASLLSLGLSSSAHAQTSWLNSLSESLYQQIQPVLVPTPAPAVYPDPQTGQPIPWTPSNPNFYGSTGIRG